MSFRALFDFEAALADYTGAPYVVVTDGCTHALELCFRYDAIQQTSFTAYTYLSVPMMLTHLGVDHTFIDQIWHGEYQFQNTRIWDSARRLEPGMYRPGQFQCLSFGWTKPLQLGKAGAILLDDFVLGWHYCPTLESCERGLDLLYKVTPASQPGRYPDLRKIPFGIAKI